MVNVWDSAQHFLHDCMFVQQTDHSFDCPPDDALDPCLHTECPMKTLISLRRCAGWSESSLGAHTILQEISILLYWTLWLCKRNTKDMVRMRWNTVWSQPLLTALASKVPFRLALAKSYDLLLFELLSASIYSKLVFGINLITDINKNIEHHNQWKQFWHKRSRLHRPP